MQTKIYYDVIQFHLKSGLWDDHVFCINKINTNNMLSCTYPIKDDGFLTEFNYKDMWLKKSSFDIIISDLSQ